MDQPDCRRCSIRDNCVRLRLSVALTWEVLNPSFRQLLSHRPPVWLFLKPSAPFTSHDAHKLTAFTALYLHTLVREVAIMPPYWGQPWSFWVFHPSICLSLCTQRLTSVCLERFEGISSNLAQKCLLYSHRLWTGLTWLGRHGQSSKVRVTNHAFATITKYILYIFISTSKVFTICEPGQTRV